MKQTTQKLFLILTLVEQTEIWITELVNEVKEIKKMGDFKAKAKEDVSAVLGSNNVSYRLQSIRNNISGLKSALKEKDFNTEENGFLSAGVFKLLDLFAKQDEDNLMALNDICMRMLDEKITHENIYIFTRPDTMYYADTLAKQQEALLNKEKNADT